MLMTDGGYPRPPLNRQPQGGRIVTMKFRIEMNERRGEFLVGLALALRASSLLFATIAMRTMGPYLTIAIRFTIAFIIIAFLFRKNITKVDAKTLLHCALIGITFFWSGNPMLPELTALKNAFRDGLRRLCRDRGMPCIDGETLTAHLPSFTFFTFHPYNITIL